MTYPAPIALMIGIGFWRPLLYDLLLFVPCNRLKRLLHLPLPGFVERIATNGDAMRQRALKELGSQT